MPVFIRFLHSDCLHSELTPTAFHPPAQGCALRATLGAGRKTRPNPEGVAVLNALDPVAATPSGLGSFLHRKPRVARVSQPWAGGWNTFGVLPRFRQGNCRNRISIQAAPQAAVMKRGGRPRRFAAPSAAPLR